MDIDLEAVERRWTTVGLTTGPADRAHAEAALARAYRGAGLTPPRRVIWAGSPAAGALAAARAAELGAGPPVVRLLRDDPCATTPGRPPAPVSPNDWVRRSGPGTGRRPVAAAGG